MTINQKIFLERDFEKSFLLLGMPVVERFTSVSGKKKIQRSNIGRDSRILNLQTIFFRF
jgi:hypothetical protein